METPYSFTFASITSRLIVAFALAAGLPSAIAALEVASPFGDHMVLQRDKDVPVWGTASPAQKVSVSFGGQVIETRADAEGRWRVALKPLTASAAPRELVVSAAAAAGAGVEKRSFGDVLVGEVWVCGGQSNMERQLGPRSGQKPIVNWEQEAAAASYPLIRQLYVTQRSAPDPQVRGQMAWTVCTPAAVSNFTAVGYFFARDLHKQLGVPVGIIHSSWGGTPVEAWTSREKLMDFGGFDSALSQLREATANPDAYRVTLEAQLAEWYSKTDPGSAPPTWADPSLDTKGWETMALPAPWEEAGHPEFNGIAWFRKTFDLPANWKGGEVELRLSAVDDIDTTWVNGVLIGSTQPWDTPRVYRIPGSALKPQGNVVAVRVLDMAAGGGIWNKELPLEVRSLDGSFEPVALRGEWLCRFSTPFSWANQPPGDVRKSSGTPTVLFNGMIAPLIPYAIRGATFYQGEANAGRSMQYRTLFPAMIADWRARWGVGDFPFLFVQIAPFGGMPPEIREAQLVAWRTTKNTAMAVTIDCGDADDIHPTNKAPVGARLALAARALAYGEKIEYSGPAFERAEFREGVARLSFSHVGGGLVAKDGPLSGFTVAGADGVFHPAKAEIDGDIVVVSAPEVPAPTAVRYGWANVAAGNLHNQAGLPASPFRSDAP